jgi:hypothetical protein
MSEKAARKLWLYYWWCEFKEGGHGPFLRTTYSSKLHTANRMQAYDRENDCVVGKMHKIQIEMEAPK